MKGIYKITNLTNNKVYIGQSYDIIRRKIQHFYLLEQNKHRNEYLQKSYNKHGKDNFIFECIEEVDDLDNREIHWINEYGGINSELTYNLKDPLTNEYSNYTRVKKSKSIIGENNPNFGNTWTQEQKDSLSKKKKGVTLEERIGKEKADLVKQKMSKSQTGLKKHTEESKDKIRQANLGDKNPAYGKGDRQVGNKNPMWGKESIKRKSVLQYTKEGVFVKEYEYLAQVFDDGFHIGNVCQAANGKLKSSGGFIWGFKTY
jgi:group I intron endonuclease